MKKEYVFIVMKYNVEDESHVLMHCPLCNDIRNQLILDVNNINPSFQDLSLQERFIQLISNPIYMYYRVVSKAICYTGCAKKRKTF